MNNYGKKNRIIVCATLVMALFSPGLSQQDTLQKAVTDTLHPGNSSASIHSLYAGAGAGSNMIYLGSSISNNLPFYSASITYGLKNSLFASVSATHLSETYPYVAFYSAALNYSHTFNSWFDISADIAGYNTAESLQDSLFSDFVFANLTTGFDWKLIYTRISFSEIVSEENGFYLQVSNSRYFETPDFFKGKSFVSFDPAIDILFGDIISIETETGSTKYGNSPPFNHSKKKPVNPTEKITEKFGLLDIEFSLPVTFNYGKFSIEAESSYLLPVNSNPYYPPPEGFYFYLNAFFKIF